METTSSPAHYSLLDVVNIGRPPNLPRKKRTPPEVEVAPFGIKVTLIEPGGFETDWAGPSSKRSAPLPDLQELHDEAEQARKQRIGKRGDPKASAAAVLKVVDAPEPPLRVFFGAAPLQVAKADYESRLKTWEEWQPVAVEAQG